MDHHRRNSDYSDYSSSSDHSKEDPPSFSSTMAALNDPSWCNCMEQPPKMEFSFKCHERDLCQLFKNEYPQIQQCMDRVSGIMNTFEEDFRRAAKGSKHGKNSGIAGGVMMGVGIGLAPFTLGASAVLVGAGAAVATGGAIGRRVWNSKKSSMQTKFKEDFEAELKEFQDKIFCMNGKMKAINQLIEEVLRDINNPKHKVSYLGKYFASAQELSRFIQIYDFGGLAAKISETVCLTGTLTGTADRVQSGLDKLSSSNDTKELDDMKENIQMLQNIVNVIKRIHALLKMLV